VGNQKSINLNADVFIDDLYPTLPDAASKMGGLIPVSLSIYGPAGVSEYLISRAITKRVAYKNWRLNGEFIRDPDDQPHRFDDLAAGDLAVFEFSGDPVPQKVGLLLLSAKSAVDSQLHAVLSPLIPGGNKTMVAITRESLANAAAKAPPSHPIWLFARDPELEAALEDAALGGGKEVQDVSKKRGKSVSAAALAAAKVSAENNGRDGEALAWCHLQKLKAEGQLAAIEWSSQANAVSPFDFLVKSNANKIVKIDAKSTSGEFKRSIHMSLSELMEASTAERYDLWRVYEINEEGAKLKIAESISEFAKSILANLKPPTGVMVDCVSIDPEVLKWGDALNIARPTEGED